METKFNPNDISIPNGNYFALPYTVSDSKLVIISAPFDVTTSYSAGSSKAPDAIIDASGQIDLFDIEYGNIFEQGIATYPINEDILALSSEARRSAEKVIEHLELGGSLEDKVIERALDKVNCASDRMNDYIYATSNDLIQHDKIVALVGGDHSTPLGLMRSIGERNQDGFGVLHIDAHADLRECFEGFNYSHASIMFNLLNEVESVKKLVQVGIRDFCEDEYNLINSDDRVVTYFDEQIAQNRYEGVNWSAQVEGIIGHLPPKVYISLDIDGLKASYCPSTGTPVPGGLEFNEVLYLIRCVVRSGRQIIGFDLNEVSPCDSSEWDANVGARLLYKLSLAALFSNSNM